MIVILCSIAHSLGKYDALKLRLWSCLCNLTKEREDIDSALFLSSLRFILAMSHLPVVFNVLTKAIVYEPIDQEILDRRSSIWRSIRCQIAKKEMIMKLIPKSRTDIVYDGIKREAVIMKAPSHHIVVKYFDSFEYVNSFYIIIEFIDGGVLQKVPEMVRVTEETTSE